MYIEEHRYKIGREHFLIGEMKLLHWTTKYLITEEKENFYVIEHEGGNDNYTLEVYKSFNEDEISLNFPVYLTMNDIGSIRFTIYALPDDVDGLCKALDLAKEKIIKHLKREQDDIASKLKLAEKL